MWKVQSGIGLRLAGVGGLLVGVAAAGAGPAASLVAPRVMRAISSSRRLARRSAPARQTAGTAPRAHASKTKPAQFAARGAVALSPIMASSSPASLNKTAMMGSIGTSPWLAAIDRPA